jgi:hypothetical protein
MRRAGPALLAAMLLTSCGAFEPPPAGPERQVVAGGAWACRDRVVAMDLVFLGNSGAFANQLSHAIGEGICVYLAGAEVVNVVYRDPVGISRVRRSTSAQTTWWTQTQNLH